MNANVLNTGVNNNNILNFHNKLRDKRCNNIVSDLNNFINNDFNEKISIEDISDISIMIQDFIAKLTNEFAKIWGIEFPNNRGYYVEICDGFEGLITKSLYSNIMIIDNDDAKFDKLLKKYEFISLNHLGVDIYIDDFELANHIKCIQYK